MSINGTRARATAAFFLLLANGMRDNLIIIDIIIDTNNSQPFGAEEERLLLLPIGQVATVLHLQQPATNQSTG